MIPGEEAAAAAGAGWTVHLRCGHSIEVPSAGAVLANAAEIVHHDLLCSAAREPLLPSPVPVPLDVPPAGPSPHLDPLFPAGFAPPPVAAIP
jgi:hypothetical protein